MRSNYRRISDFIRLVDERNIGLKVKTLLGLTISKEFIPSVANIVGSDMENYKIIRKNQFACSLMQVRRDKKIPVALLKEIDEAIISQAYPIFEIENTEELLPEYLMMWFSRSEFDREACFYAVGGIRGSLEWEDFCNMQLPVPSIEKQREIVKEYNTIVNRIKLNEQLIKKLEETAQAIYKQWFVDFEFPDENGKPYKSSGGEMVYNTELDKEIPKRWNFKTLDNFIELKNGKTRPKESGKFPVYGGNGIMDYADSYNAENVITIGRVGENCGNVFYEPNKCWVSDNAIYAICYRDFYLYFYYTLTAMQLNNSTEGTGQPLLTQDILYRKSTIFPNDDKIVRRFERIANVIYKSCSVSKKDIALSSNLANTILGKMAKE